MIQDIAPHRFWNHFEPGRELHDEVEVFCFNGRRVLVKEDESAGSGGSTFSLPLVKDFSMAAQAGAVSLRWLFKMDEKDYAEAVYTSNGYTAPDGFRFVEMNELRYHKTLPKEWMFLLYTAYHLDGWYKDNRYCGRCRAEMEDSKTERALVCPRCGKVVYPRINPAVIVAVVSGDEIVLTQYAGRSISYNALVAGFTEIGETFEETVEREVMEEIGLKVKNIRYYKSQPWGMAADILAGYFCEADGDRTIHMEANELKKAEWTKRENIVLQPDEFSLTNEMMTIFKEGRDPYSLEKRLS